MAKYGFLLDRNCEYLASSLRGRVYVLGDVGLPDTASDQQIFNVAGDRELTIATQNVTDFTRIMRDAVQRAGARRCGDGWGLLVPNAVMRFDFADLSRRLKFNGHGIDWEDVAELNLCVMLGQQSPPQVHPLPRCPRCLCDHDCRRCRDLGLLDVSWETLGG